MTTKLQAIIAGAVAGFTSFAGWFVTLSPDSQNAFVAPLLEAVPVSWRPGIGVAMKLLASASMSYGIYQAAHSGPQSPPRNPET